MADEKRISPKLSKFLHMGESQGSESSQSESPKNSESKKNKEKERKPKGHSHERPIKQKLGSEQENLDWSTVAARWKAYNEKEKQRTAKDTSKSPQNRESSLKNEQKSGIRDAKDHIAELFTWTEIKDLLKSKTTEQAFQAWIDPILCTGIFDERIELKVPNEFFKTWIEDCFLDHINDAIKQLSGKLLLIDISVDENILSKEESSHTEIDYDLVESASGVSQEKLRTPDAPKEPLKRHPSLHSKYVFDNFVVGSSNQIAHAAAWRVARSPGASYNPIFIYSHVGLGKTHLLHAVGNYIHQNHPNLRIHYTSAEKFVNELIDSIQHGKMAQFRNKYRDELDVLLVDDIQFIAKKDRTQEEFFHTFNFLYNAKKQIVFTSDKLPKEIDGLEDRLRTRFEWGLMADIQPPEIETRMAILKRKAEEDDIYLPDDVGMLLATNVRTNIRELEGSLVRIGAYASITNTEINLEMAKEVLKDLIHDEPLTEITPESILKSVAQYYKLRVSDLKRKTRLKEFSFPRQISMYLARKLAQRSFTEIGSIFGGKDHTTVMHAVRKIEKMRDSDPEVRKQIHEIESLL
jgi:chromosomal replication initiator protein